MLESLDLCLLLHHTARGVFICYRLGEREGGREGGREGWMDGGREGGKRRSNNNTILQCGYIVKSWAYLVLDHFSSLSKV